MSNCPKSQVVRRENYHDTTAHSHVPDLSVFCKGAKGQNLQDSVFLGICRAIREPLFIHLPLPRCASDKPHDQGVSEAQPLCVLEDQWVRNCILTARSKGKLFLDKDIKDRMNGLTRKFNTMRTKVKAKVLN